MKVIHSKDKDPVDLTLWREGRATPADVAAAFDNTPGLAAKPMALPPRTAINLPDDPAVVIVKTIRLWD